SVIRSARRRWMGPSRRGAGSNWQGGHFRRCGSGRRDLFSTRPARDEWTTRKINWGTQKLAGGCLRPQLLHLIAQQDGLGNFTHRLASLAALALHHAIGLVLINGEFALEHALGAVDCFAGFQAVGELDVF